MKLKDVVLGVAVTGYAAFLLGIFCVGTFYQYHFRSTHERRK